MIGSDKLSSAVLRNLLLDIKELNELLREDQNYLLHGLFDALEESAIRKLTVKNKLDAQIEQLKKIPQWTDLTQNPGREAALDKEHLMLWRCINEELNTHFTLFQVNQKVVSENQAFQRHMMNCLSPKDPNTAVMLYDNKAQLG